MESMGFEPMRDINHLQAFQTCLFSLLSNFPKIYPPEMVGFITILFKYRFKYQIVCVDFIRHDGKDYLIEVV